MYRASLLFISALFTLLFVAPSLTAQEERTIGLLHDSPDAYDGYTLFAPMGSKTTYLIDMKGRIVNTWESEYRPGMSVYLLENGGIFRCGMGNVGTGEFTGSGVVQEFDWEGNLVWEYNFPNDSTRQHHDAIKLPSGNVLAVLWEIVTQEEAIALGRDPDLVTQRGLWVDYLMEVRPVGSDSAEVVWEWHALDHLVQEFDPTKPNAGRVADHPELLDFNYADPKADWLHINSVAYNEELDQIVISSPFINEIMIVDHSTTTEEAAGSTGGRAGRGGDILYRWGNPQVYDAEGGQQLYFQHNAHWIPEGNRGAGNIMVFNNGDGRLEGEFSEVYEIVTPLQEDGTYALETGQSYGPTAPVWSYSAPTPGDFYSPRISGAQRLPNGNTLICSGQDGWFFEVTPAGEIAWEYISPVTQEGILEQGSVPEKQDNPVFRAERYGVDHPAFAGRTLVPGDFIELYTNSVEGEIEVVEELSIE